VTPEESGDPSSAQGSPQPSEQNIFNQGDPNWWAGGKKLPNGEEFNPRKLDTPLDKMMRSYAGRRSVTHTERKRGRYIQSRPANGRTDDLAFDATLRAAAPFQNQRGEIKARNHVAFAIRSSDYMKKIRVRRAANLILFLVDASWSMAVAERMAATKGAILSLLTDAYQRRDRVGLIVFQKSTATLVLPPTNSVMLAQEALSNIPVGGKTPLSAGLMMSFDVLRKEKILHPDVMPLLIILTDGAGNVPVGHLPPQDESYLVAERIAKAKIHSVVINMEHAAFDQGLAQALADHLECPCYTITDLKAESLFVTVRNEIQQANKPYNLDFK
jgi:magnesium chelatase subunit D